METPARSKGRELPRLALESTAHPTATDGAWQSDPEQKPSYRGERAPGPGQPLRGPSSEPGPDSQDAIGQRLCSGDSSQPDLVHRGKPGSCAPEVRTGQGSALNALWLRSTRPARRNCTRGPSGLL